MAMLTLETQVSEEEDWDTDVVSHKVGDVPGHESVKTLEDGEQDGDTKGEIGEVRLERLDCQHCGHPRRRFHLPR